jgi:hypothetical protein
MQTSFRAVVLRVTARSSLIASRDSDEFFIANQFIGHPTSTPTKDRETVGFLTDGSAKAGVRESVDSGNPLRYKGDRPNAPPDCRVLNQARLSLLRRVARNDWAQRFPSAVCGQGVVTNPSPSREKNNSLRGTICPTRHRYEELVLAKSELNGL